MTPHIVFEHRRDVWRCGLLLALVAATRGFDARSPAEELPLAERVHGRDYPSIFQAWTDAKIPGVSSIDAIARHDLIWLGQHDYGLRSVEPFEGEGTAFAPASIAAGLSFRAELLRRNPHVVLLADVLYRHAPLDWLPEDHRWWKRDGAGRRLPGWQGGDRPWFLLNFDQQEFRAHVARQAAALAQSGVVDGVMLDLYGREDPARVDLVRQVRQAIGPDKLIIVNSNANRPLGSAPYINGIFMETDPHAPPWVNAPSVGRRHPAGDESSAHSSGPRRRSPSRASTPLKPGIPTAVTNRRTCK